MIRTKLTDSLVSSLEPAEEGTRSEVFDTKIDRLAVRVTESGEKSFVLYIKLPGRPGASRYKIGNATRMTVDGARKKARQWLDMIEQGIDPRSEARRRRLTEARSVALTFESVAEEFIRLVASRQRRGAEMAREIRKEFVTRWRERPISDITAHDVMAVLDEAVGRGAPYQAHNLLGHVRRLFNWAIGRGIYGLDRSPCDKLRPKDAVGPRPHRTRVLNNAELRAMWRAAEVMGYPYGQLVKILALTGLRKNEAARARWSEFDLDSDLWTIPSERMKGNVAHVVPLTAETVSVLESVPHFAGGDYLFTAMRVRPGARAVNDFHLAKQRLDALMREELGDFPPFTFHDIRRTMRTGLSSLAVPGGDIVRELIIAHTQKG
ncbi:MAG TPA: tyrosine-type recombinase/integrase, partial [Xanthobacteraceae bacterium]